MKFKKAKGRYALYLLLLLVFGCQPEEVAPILVETQTQRLIVAAEQIPEVTQTLLTKLTDGEHFSQFSVNNGEAVLPFEINWGRILQLIEASGKETYTFGMTVDDNDPATFYNLVLRYSENKEAHQPFIMKYNMSETFFPQYLATGSLVGFEGDVQRIKIKESTGGGERRGTAILDPGDIVLGDPCPPSTDVKAPGSGGPDEGDTGDNGSSVYECEDYIVTNKWYNKVCREGTCSTELVEITISVVTECGWSEVNESAGEDDECAPEEGEIPMIDEIPDPLELILGEHNLSTAELQKLRDALNEMLGEDCYFRNLINHMTSNNARINFEVNSSVGGSGAYNPSRKTISVPFSSSLSVSVLREEFIHAYQDLYYGGTLQYAGAAGASNIEFEAKFMMDVASAQIGFTCCAVFTGYSTYGSEFQAWIMDTVLDASGNLRDFSSFQAEYFEWIEIFKQENPQYNYPTLPNFMPSAMLNSYNSGCN